MLDRKGIGVGKNTCVTSWHGLKGCWRLGVGKNTRAIDSIESVSTRIYKDYRIIFHLLHNLF